MSTRRTPSPLATPSPHPMSPRCSGGASSLLRMGLGALPQRALTTTRRVADRPLLLQHRAASLQLCLFGARGGR